MNKLMAMAKRFHQEEDGAAMVEYSILLGIIAAASIVAIIAIGSWVHAQFFTLCGNLNGKGAAATALTCGS